MKRVSPKVGAGSPKVGADSPLVGASSLAGGAVDSSIKNWFVLYTKPRNEKKVAEQLAKLGIDVYCPMVKTIKQWSDRKKKVSEPLFKSYVFVKIEEKMRDSVFQANGVVRYLFWLGKPAIVKEKEIEAIRNFLSETDYSEKALEFEYLQDVDIKHGLFKGQKGKYLYTSKNKLVLEIESLGIAVKASLPYSQVV